MTKSKEDVFERITKRIIKELEKGVIPWHQPWSSLKANQAVKTNGWDAIWPRNAISGQPYGGANVMMTWMHALDLGLVLGDAKPLFLTYKQAEAAGGHVKKGQRGTIVIGYRDGVRREKDEETGETTQKKFRSAFGHVVFHISQTEGVKIPRRKVAEPVGLEDDKAWKAFLTSTGATIRHGGARAFYSVRGDYIGMPTATAFKSSNHYKSTMAHELIHWTGHKARCDRNLSGVGSAYAFEELIAGIGDAFLCAQLGLNLTGLDQTEYIAMWLGHLKDDKTFVVKAATQAGRAASYIIDLTKEALDAHAARQNRQKGHSKPKGRLHGVGRLAGGRVRLRGDAPGRKGAKDKHGAKPGGRQRQGRATRKVGEAR